MFIRRIKKGLSAKSTSKSEHKTPKVKTTGRSSTSSSSSEGSVTTKLSSNGSYKEFSDISKEANADTGVVKRTMRPEQMVHARILRSAKDAAGSDNKIELQLRILPEELLARGFEIIDVEIRDIRKRLDNAPTPAAISAALNERIYRRYGQKIATVDVKEAVDNFLMEKLRKGEVQARQDELQITPIVVPATKKMEIPFVKNRGASVSEEASFTDSTGNLEARLGGSAEEKIGSTIVAEEASGADVESTIRNANNIEASSEDFLATDTESTAPTREAEPFPEISKVFNAKEFNKANRRPFPGITKKELLFGTNGPSRTRMMHLFKTIKQRPKLQGIRTRRRPRHMKKSLHLQLPTAGKEMILIMRNPHTGERRYKTIMRRPDYRIAKRKVEFYKTESRLPMIWVARLDGNLVNVVVNQPHGTRISDVEIWRREISTRQFEDEYEKIQTLEFSADSKTAGGPQKQSSFVDVVSNEGIYKYVAVPVVDGQPLPLYSYRIYRTANWRASRTIEPTIYGYQQSQRVALSLRGLPPECKKVLVYRNSSLDGEEILIDGKLNYGRRGPVMRFYDYPSPVEQTIEYIFKSVDDNGIVSQFSDKPIIKFNARLGEEPATILSLVAKFDRETESVTLTGVFQAVNAFEAPGGDVLENPDDKTLQAAARGQTLCKLVIRRIDLTTGDDETLMEPIVNLGISSLDVSVAGDNRVRFEFVDSSEHAVTNGYTPLFSNRSYLYVCRMSAYPLSIELRQVADVTSVAGIVDGDRLPYRYDPIVFDHPSNTELGILPAGMSRRSLEEVLQISMTSVARTAQIYLPRFEPDVTIDFQAQVRIDYGDEKMVQIKFSIPDALTDDLDHIKLIAGVDSLTRSATIDRMFVPDSRTMIYYDYQMLDQIGNTITYQIYGIGKDFRKLFVSQTIEVSIPEEEEK